MTSLVPFLFAVLLQWATNGLPIDLAFNRVLAPSLTAKLFTPRPDEQAIRADNLTSVGPSFQRSRDVAYPLLLRGKELVIDKLSVQIPAVAENIISFSFVKKADDFFGLIVSRTGGYYLAMLDIPLKQNAVQSAISTNRNDGCVSCIKEPSPKHPVNRETAIFKVFFVVITGAILFTILNKRTPGLDGPVEYFCLIYGLIVFLICFSLGG